MTLNSALMYPTPLTPQLKEQASAKLQEHRVLLADSLLSKFSAPESAAKLGGNAQQLQSLFGELLQRSASSPAELSRFFGHWSVSLLMARLLSDEAFDTQRAHLTDNLVAHMLGARLRGLATQEPASYVSSSDFYLLGHNARLRVRGPEGASRIAWEFSGNQVALRAEGQQAAFANLTLPLARGSSPLEVEPLAQAGSWRVPIIEDNNLLGLSGRQYQEDIPSDGVSEDGWKPLSMGESLEGAHRLLSQLWPEVIAWAEVLLPCFVDMGGPANKSVHRSASYGAGTPIFLTKVGDPFEHAEDIVHEMQHERLALLWDTSVFAKWNDPKQIYCSPYRSDPRPMRGLHLGVHAFLAVNQLRLLAHEREALSRHRRYQLVKTHRMNLYAFRTMLEHEEIAPAGRPVFAQLARELSRQHAPIQALTEPEMATGFDTRMDAHVASVKAVAPIINADPSYRDWDKVAELAARYADREEVRS